MNPKWVDFEITQDGFIRFLQKVSDFICYVCKSKINENPITYSGLYFHVNHLEVYKKLVGIYGLSLSGLRIFIGGHGCKFLLHRYSWTF